MAGPSTSAAAGSTAGPSDLGATIGVVAGAVVLSILVVSATTCFVLRRRRRRRTGSLPSTSFVDESDKSTSVLAWPPATDVPSAILSTAVPTQAPAKPFVAPTLPTRAPPPSWAPSRPSFITESTDTQFSAADDPWLVTLNRSSTAASQSQISWDLSTRLSNVLWDRRAAPT